MSQLSLLPMDCSDIDDVTALEQQLAAFPWTRTHFADSLKAGYSGWVARDQHGQLAGFAVLMMAVDEGHLLNLGVAADQQRQGLGSRLLRRVMERARAAGGVSLLLEVRPSNTPALALYQHLGFAEIGRRKAYYPAATGREDALVFRLELERVDAERAR